MSPEAGATARHPRGLSTLFFTEMWERFSYYGMRAFLVLFMVAPPASGGLGFSDAHAGMIYGLYTSMVYLLHTCGELCLSPVGLSAMTRLAPGRTVGLIMGVCFLATSLGNYMAGRAVGLTQSMSLEHFFLMMTIVPVSIGVILLVLARLLRRLLALENVEALVGTGGFLQAYPPKQGEI